MGETWQGKFSFWCQLLKELPIIPVGSVVMVYDHQPKCWKLGKGDSRDSENNHSYFVKLENGTMVSRNWVNLRPTSLLFVEQSTQSHSNINKINAELTNLFLMQMSHIILNQLELWLNPIKWICKCNCFRVKFVKVSIIADVPACRF